MAKIEMKDMNVLVTASAAKTTAGTAAADTQEEAVAFAINSAANCGEYRTTFHESLIASVQSKLETKGYKIEYCGVADEKSAVIISWE